MKENKESAPKGAFFTVAVAGFVLLFDLMTNIPTYCSTANRADCTAARQNCANDGASSGTDCRILIVPGHVGTSSQTKYECQHGGTYCQFLYGIHL
jgi:hypothetical protein